MSLEFATEFCLDNENNELKIKNTAWNVFSASALFTFPSKSSISMAWMPLQVQFLSPSQPQAPPHPRRHLVYFPCKSQEVASK